MASDKVVLLVEPYYSGSHKHMIDLIHENIRLYSDLVTMRGVKWHWRARTAAIWYSEEIPKKHNYRVLFATSVLNLAELLTLRPDLVPLRKILYFHENQLVYPVKDQKHRDFQYGYNQILSCLVADQVVFNSAYNMQSFLDHIDTFLGLMPDYRPRMALEKIKPKCSVLYFPLVLPELSIIDAGLPTTNAEGEKILRILWPHRWEHDKAPEEFFEVLFRLKENSHPFELVVLGESFSENPPIFDEASEKLCDEIVTWGFEDDREAYWRHLRQCDVVVSTTKHEFFGVAMLEAVWCGCYPLCPNRLVFPEIFADECLYNTSDQLFKRLREFSRKPNVPRRLASRTVDFSKYTWDTLQHQYRELLLPPGWEN